MQIACRHCSHPTDLDHHSAGRTIRCAACGKSFIAPADLAVVGQRHSLTAFPVASLFVLHYVTAGIFSIIHLNMLHDRMPRLRRDDPSATVAIGLCFVPVVNLYWFLFTFRRLCVRINEQRRFSGLSENAPEWLGIPVGALLGCGLTGAFFTSAGLYLLGTVGIVVMPLFAILVQNAVNGLCDEEEAGVPASAC